MSLVAIIGRPNVGKSTLFNRLVGKRKAIVDNISGVTRDRHYGKCDWCGTEFSVVDTGGYTYNSDDIFEDAIKKQVEIAIEESDVILFMVDAMGGITDYDSELAKVLRQCGKPVILTANKVDNGERIFETFEFYKLGLGEIFSISAANGSGTGDLLDEVLRVMPEEAPKSEDDELADLPRIAIVGKPNVGKSSFTNALLGEDRNIVTPKAGTTRDSVSSRYNKYGHDFVLVDTAGIRRKSKVHEDLEFYSVMRSIRAIEDSDVCIMMIDARTGMEAQDMNIFNLIIKNKKGCVLVINKWDLIIKDNDTMREYTESMRERLAPFDDIPIIFTSVLNKQRIMDVIDATDKVYMNYSQKITTGQLNRELLPEIENCPPPAWKGKYIRIKYITQLPTKTPSFAFFCNRPQYVREPYKRFLDNALRRHFNFEGCPINIFMRKK